MNRIAVTQQLIAKVLEKQADPLDRRAPCIHTYGVAQACALLAKKRGQDVELAAIAGLLHDRAACATCLARELGIPV